MHAEQKALEQKNYELGERYKEKSKQQQQTQKLYTLLKSQQLAAGYEIAADHDADYVLREAGHAQHGNHRGHQPMQSRGSNGSRGSGGQSRTIQAWEQQQQQVPGSRVGLQSSRMMPFQNKLIWDMLTTLQVARRSIPSQHRRLAIVSA